MTKKLVLSVVSAFLTVHLLNAQFYGGAKIGFLNYLNDEVVESDFKFEPGFGIQGGAFVNDNIFIEGNVDYYFRSKNNEFFGFNMKTIVSSLVVAANGKYLVSDDNVSFYITSDAGINNFKIVVKTNTNTVSESYTLFGFAPGAGVFIGKDNDVMLKIETKYHIFLKNKDLGTGLNGIGLNIGIYKKF